MCHCYYGEINTLQFNLYAHHKRFPIPLFNNQSSIYILDRIFYWQCWRFNKNWNDQILNKIAVKKKYVSKKKIWRWARILVVFKKMVVRSASACILNVHEYFTIYVHSHIKSIRIIQSDYITFVVACSRGKERYLYSWLQI